MILLYLEVGKFLYDVIESSDYGDKVIDKASEFMKNMVMPNTRGC